MKRREIASQIVGKLWLLPDNLPVQVAAVEGIINAELSVERAIALEDKLVAAETLLRHRDEQLEQAQAELIELRALLRHAQEPK